MKTFAVLQLSGCAGCEVSLLDADAWVGEYQLVYMPLVITTHDVPEVDVLLVSGGVQTDEDLFRLRRAVRQGGVRAFDPCIACATH
jgi:coenzyme F420-reducing hydrogenase gamma subunit